VAKLIILSIVLVSFIVPIWLSTSSQPRTGLRKAQRVILVFILVWAWMCLKWYPELVPLK
jgi:hypothetical protein